MGTVPFGPEVLKLVLATAALMVAAVAARPCAAQMPQHGQTNQGPAQFDYPDIDPQDVVIPASSAGLAVESDDDARAEQQILAALQQPIELNFVNTPLSEVQKSLEAKLQIPINLDDKPLRDAGVTDETDFTLSGRFPTAREALHELLESKDLNWLVSGGVLQITTSDVAKSTTVVRVYPVSDLCITTDGEGNYSYDFDSLIELITSTVSPSSWDQNGGAGSIAPHLETGTITLSQTREVHEQIAHLLERLRQSRHLQGLDAGFHFAREDADEDRPIDDSSGSLPRQITSPPPTTGGMFDVSASAAPAAQPSWRTPRVYH